MSELAVVRVRGGIRVDYRILDALTKLNLRRKNACVLIPNTPTSLGMLKKAKDYITATFGEKYALEKPRGFKTKSKLAQEAHEAIRPTRLNPDLKTTEKLTINHKKLYSLIFNRAVSCQMKEAEIKIIKINIEGEKKYLFESVVEQVYILPSR